MKISTFALTLSLVLSAPLYAQRMGGTNRNAPSLSQAFTAQDGFDFHVDYTAITWADGQTMERIMDKERGEGYRQRINNNASSAPLGSLRCKTATNLGGTDMQAGLYALYFTIDDDCVWHLNAQHEEDSKVKYSWKLDLKEQEKHKARLSLTVAAAEKANECELTIAFGKMATTVHAKKGEEMKKPEKKMEKAGTGH